MEIIVVSSPESVDEALDRPAEHLPPEPETLPVTLEGERLDRLAESASTNARIHDLEEALEAANYCAQGQIKALEAQRFRRRLRLGTAALLIIGGVLLQALLYGQFRHESPVSPPAPLADSSLRRLARLPSHADAHSRTALPSQSELALGAEQLGGALAIHPEQAWPQIIDHIRQTSGPAVCPFIWVDGNFAFVLAEAPLGIGSLPASLGRCADAVNETR